MKLLAIGAAGIIGRNLKHGLADAGELGVRPVKATRVVEIQALASPLASHMSGAGADNSTP